GVIYKYERAGSLLGESPERPAFLPGRVDDVMERHVGKGVRNLCGDEGAHPEGNDRGFVCVIPEERDSIRIQEIPDLVWGKAEPAMTCEGAEGAREDAAHR